MITRHLRFGLVEVLLALACFVSLGILISARSLQSVAINQSIAINKSVANNQSNAFSLSQLVCSYYTQANERSPRVVLRAQSATNSEVSSRGVEPADHKGEYVHACRSCACRCNYLARMASVGAHTRISSLRTKQLQRYQSREVEPAEHI